MHSPGIKCLFTTQLAEHQYYYIGNRLDKSKGINYERVAIWYKEKWKRGRIFNNGSAELTLNFEYQLLKIRTHIRQKREGKEEQREKRRNYRQFAFESRERSND